jgi:ribonuclease P protein subunit POP4
MVGNLYKGNLMGKIAQVKQSKDSSLIGTRGLIVEDTKNMLLIETSNKRIIKIPKSIVVIDLQEGTSKSLAIEGTNLIGTPAERIKS